MVKKVKPMRVGVSETNIFCMAEWPRFAFLKAFVGLTLHTPHIYTYLQDKPSDEEKNKSQEEAEWKRASIRGFGDRHNVWNLILVHLSKPNIKWPQWNIDVLYVCAPHRTAHTVWQILGSAVLPVCVCFLAIRKTLNHNGIGKVRWLCGECLMMMVAGE